MFVDVQSATSFCGLLISLLLIFQGLQVHGKRYRDDELPSCDAFSTVHTYGLFSIILRA